MLTSVLSRIESMPLLDTVTKEAVGINAPRVAVTRTRDERMDVAVSAGGNMLAAFGAVPLVGMGLNKIFKSATEGSAKHWAVASKSLGIYSAMFALMWAMPFLRNYYTAQKTGKIEFASVISGGGETATDKQKVEAAKKDYLKKAMTIIGIGAAGTLLATLGGKMAIQKGLPFGKAALKITEKCGLKDGSFNNFKGLKAVMFWGVPAYAGWIHASRDKFEIKEQLLKFGAFVFSFLVPQKLMDKFYAGKFEKLLGKNMDATYKNITKTLSGPHQKELQKTALKHWRNRNLLGLASSIVLLGTLPLVLNIYLTAKRMKNSKPASAAAPVPSGNLQIKPFEAWGQRPKTLPQQPYSQPVPSR